MKKYLKVFRGIVLLLSCWLCTTDAAERVSIKNKLGDFQLPPYKAKVGIHTHGLSKDVLTPIVYKKISLGYGHFSIQSVYRGAGSLVSLGGGYRQFINPLWVGGFHAHIEGGRLPQGLGYYAKLSPGVEAHTARGRIGFNMYFPIQISQFNATLDLEKVQTRDYTGHTEREWRYMDQNQISCDIAGDYHISEYFSCGVGLYGAKQVNNPSIIGLMTRLEYSWNHYLSFQAKYSLDSFHDHSFTLGVQCSINRLQTAASTNSLLWRFVDRHIAPLQMIKYDALEDVHHCFFDAGEKNFTTSDASYENPSSKLNHELLERLRQHYPDEVQRVVLHLSGAFDLAEGEKASLELEPYEHLQGERCQEGALCTRKTCVKDAVCQFDFIKFFDGSRNEFVLDENCFSEIPKVINCNESLLGGKIKRDAQYIKTHRTLGMLFENERVIDGRAILRGAVYMNDHTSLSQLAILPATKVTNVRSTALDKTSTFDSQISAIIVPKKENNLPIEKVSIKDVVISGWPGHPEPYQYENGIELSGCISPEIASVWVNHAQVGIWLNGVSQSQVGALQDIYIGSPHLTANLDRIEEVKHALRDIKKEFNARPESAYELNQTMLDNLKTRMMIPSRDLKHIKGIRTDHLPSSITFNGLDIESRVLVGMHAQRASSVAHGDPIKPNKGAWLETLKSFNPFKTKVSHSKKQLPQDLSLNISNSFVMAEMLPIFVSDQLHLRLENPILASRYLGACVKDAHLSLVGNKNSFVYVRSSEGLFRIKEAAHSIGWLKPLKDNLERKGKQLPQAFYLEGDKMSPEKTSATLINMGVIMMVPSDHWLSRISPSNVNEFFTRDSEQSQLIYQDTNNLFLALYPQKAAEDRLPIINPPTIKTQHDVGHQRSVSEAPNVRSDIPSRSADVLRKYHMQHGRNLSSPSTSSKAPQHEWFAAESKSNIAPTNTEEKSPTISEILDLYRNRRFSGSKEPVDLQLTKRSQPDGALPIPNNRSFQKPKVFDTSTSVLQTKVDCKSQSSFNFQHSNTDNAWIDKTTQATSQPNGNRMRGLSIDTQDKSLRRPLGKRIPVKVKGRIMKSKTPTTPTFRVTKPSSHPASPQIPQKTFASYKAGNGLAKTMTSQAVPSVKAGTQLKALNGAKQNGDKQIPPSEAVKPHRNKSPFVSQEAKKSVAVPVRSQQQKQGDRKIPKVPNQIDSANSNVMQAPYETKINNPSLFKGLGITSIADRPDLFGDATAAIAAIGSSRNGRELTLEQKQALIDIKKHQRTTMKFGVRPREEVPPVPSLPK